MKAPWRGHIRPQSSACASAEEDLLKLIAKWMRKRSAVKGRRAIDEILNALKTLKRQLKSISRVWGARGWFGSTAPRRVRFGTGKHVSSALADEFKAKRFLIKFTRNMDYMYLYSWVLDLENSLSICIHYKLTTIHLHLFSLK